MGDIRIRWGGSATAARWIRNLKRQLENGGLAVVKDYAGLTSRVAGETGITQPRTRDIGDALSDRLVRPAEAGVPLSACQHEIETNGDLRTTRNGLDLLLFPTAAQ